MRIGSYDVIKQIGEGGFAKTYEARHIILGTRACIKQNISLNSEDAKMLEDEVKKMWDLSHHSLPAMRDFYKLPDGSYAMVMSYIEGKTLDQAVKKHKAIHPEDCCWIAQRLLNGLHYLHSNGVIHGDVKPPNVIVQPKVHNAVLVDFGLSSIKPKSTSKAVGYTPVFAAPEIIEGRPPLPESDIYSLGLTMIYTLGGDPLAKTYPGGVPDPIQQYFNGFVCYNPLDRSSWEKEDLVQKLSNVRLEVFGRRFTT